MTELKLEVEPGNPPAYENGYIVQAVIDRAPVTFFVKNTKDPIQNCHYRGCFFEPEELRIIAPHIADGAVVLDVGANIGNHALFFEKLTPAKSVILFEVNPDAIAILRMNQRLNACRTWDDQYLGFGLADRNAWMDRVVGDPNNLGGTQFHPATTGAFKCIAGDEVLAHRRIDFIKMDIEGGEIAALKGLQETITRWRPPIFVELQDNFLPQFLPFLDAINYEIAVKHERYRTLPNYLVTPRR